MPAEKRIAEIAARSRPDTKTTDARTVEVFECFPRADKYRSAETRSRWHSCGRARTFLEVRSIEGEVQLSANTAQNLTQTG